MESDQAFLTNAKRLLANDPGIAAKQPFRRGAR